MLVRIITYLGHEAEACSDPTYAIEHHALWHFDMVLSDYMMKPDGLQVLAAFNTSYRVLLTASYGTSEISDALRVGVVHLVLTKPANLADLKAACFAAEDWHGWSRPR